MKGLVLLLTLLAVGYAEAAGYTCSYSIGRKLESSSGRAHPMIIPCKWHAIHAQRCGNYRIFVTPGNQIDEKGNQFMSTMFLGFADVATGQRWSGHLSVTTIQGFVDEVRDEPFHTLFKSVDYDVHDIVTWTSEEVGEYSGVTFTAKNQDFEVRFNVYDSSEGGERHKSSGFTFTCNRDGTKDDPKKYPDQICGGKDAADKNTINQRKNELGLDSLAQTALFDALIFDKTAQPQYKDLQLFEGGMLYNSTCRSMENAFINRCSSDAKRAEAVKTCFPIIDGADEKKCLVQDADTPTPNDVFWYCLEFVCSDYKKEPFCPHLKLALDSCSEAEFSTALKTKVNEVCPEVNTVLCE